MVTTLISWYDEKPEWLGEAVASVAIFSNQVIAVDGAYELFPGGSHRSGLDQSAEIRKAALGYGLACTIVEPTYLWKSEIQKRNAMFSIAEALTSEHDWYFILDADEYIEKGPTTFDNVTEDVIDVNVNNGRFDRPYPKFFRAIRGLRARSNHWTYALPDGRRFWGHGHRGVELVPAANMIDNVTIIHRADDRTKSRRNAALGYYRIRDHAGVETDE